MDTNSLLPWVQGMARASWQAGILVIMVLVAQWLLRKRLSPQWRCGLWLLVMGRLLLPISFGSAASIFNLLPAWNNLPRPATDMAARPTPATGLIAPEPGREFVFPVAPPANHAALPQPASSAVPETAAPPSAATFHPAKSPAPAPRRELSLELVVVGLWLLGVAGLLGYVAGSSWRVWRQIRKITPVTDCRVLDLLAQCQSQMRVSRKLTLVESEAVSTPALHGIIRPRLLLPRGFAHSFYYAALTLSVVIFTSSVTSDFIYFQF